MLAQAPVSMQIGLVKVGAMQSDARIFFGQNVQNGWDSHSKSNTAGASPAGDGNCIPIYYNFIFDPDVIDVPINDQDIKSPTLAHIMGV
ncbi:spore germination protein [Alicyclobacillus herbarius]|uniref:spore germination protein n=1 Tax=Alicyclobacillus herbarius TaxID=122960 RepID=UPI0006881C24|nr:spore germination protein [Alicyclobacillus herbarius]